MTRRENIIGRSVFEAFSENPDDPTSTGMWNLRASLERVLATGAADAMEVQQYDLRRPADQGGDVEERYWSAVNSPVFASRLRPEGDEGLEGHEGSVQYIIHRIEDVTELYVRARELQQATTRQRELEMARADAERASRAKDEFLSVISHELRTPLNVIQGWIWQLKRAGASAEAQRRALDIIERNVSVQARLVEDLLDTSRAALGKLHLRKEVVDLCQACAAAVDSIEGHAQAQGLTVTLLTPEVPLFICGDGDRIQQAVSNVLSNALKFTPPGGSIEVRADREGTRARVTITDTGTGVPAEFLPTMFDPFAQADKTTTRTFGGLGLGLAIVKQIVTLHGGTVTAASDGDEQGTSVTLDFPVPAVLEEPGERTTPRDDRRPAEQRLSGIRVLVVDDEPDAHEAVRLVLEGHGALVRTAASTAEALAIMRDLSPDVIVADLAMPGHDGYELIRQVRTLDATRHVPAVALTAYTDAAREPALTAGFHQFSSKPIRADELVALVQNLTDPATVH
jgi:signal transduction histidine kinase/ActR/RegA family two-component response regulator